MENRYSKLQKSCNKHTAAMLYAWTLLVAESGKPQFIYCVVNQEEGHAEQEDNQIHTW